MISILIHRNHTTSELSLEELHDYLGESEHSDSFVWIDLENPSAEEEELVLTQIFRFHHLAIEDCSKEKRDGVSHHPKVEEFDSFVFAILNEIRYSNVSPIETLQINAFILQDVLVTYHSRVADSIDHVRNLCLRGNSLMDKGPDFIFHYISDSLVDDMSPIIENVEQTIEAITERVLASNEKNILQDVLKLRNDVLHIRKISVYHREVLARLSRGDFMLVSEKERFYYRNVYDHLVRVGDSFEGFRESISTLIEMHVSMSSQRLNQIMKVLTIFSSIFLPITFLAGVYGMNFHVFPELSWHWAYAGFWVVVIGISVAMLLFFKRQGWLEQ